MSIDFNSTYPEFPSIEDKWSEIAPKILECPNNRKKLSPSLNELV